MSCLEALASGHTQQHITIAQRARLHVFATDLFDIERLFVNCRKNRQRHQTGIYFWRSL
jgi:hypothetical protein